MRRRDKEIERHRQRSTKRQRGRDFNNDLTTFSQEPRVARTLVLLSKMLQRLANCCVADQPLNTKEPWLTEVLTRVTDDAHKSAMVRFLDRISLHVSDPSLSTESAFLDLLA